MTQPEAVFFDCDGTLVDSEVICSRAYVHMFQEFGITLDLAEIFKRFKGVKLYEIIDTINAEYGVNLQKATLEPIYRAEVARLFDSELEVIPGAQALLDAVSVPMCVVSNGPVSKMQHSLGRTGLLRHFTDRLYSGYDIQRWKPDPALMFHAAEAMLKTVFWWMTPAPALSRGLPPAWKCFISAPIRTTSRSIIPK